MAKIHIKNKEGDNTECKSGLRPTLIFVESMVNDPMLLPMALGPFKAHMFCETCMDEIKKISKSYRRIVTEFMEGPKKRLMMTCTKEPNAAVMGAIDVKVVPVFKNEQYVSLSSPFDKKDINSVNIGLEFEESGQCVVCDEYLPVTVSDNTVSMSKEARNHYSITYY